MGEKRDASTADTATERARRALEDAWVEHGWPRPPRGPGYQVLQQRVIEYLGLAFPGLEPSCAAQLAEVSLTDFMAPLHANAGGGRAPEPPEPAALTAAVRHAVVDRMRPPAGDPQAPHPNEKDDEWLAKLAVGAAPDAVRAGLSALVAERARTDFLIVTQYLDLADRDRTRPPRSAEVVARLGDDAVSEAAVRQAILAFRSTVARLARP